MQGDVLHAIVPTGIGSRIYWFGDDARKALAVAKKPFSGVS